MTDVRSATVSAATRRGAMLCALLTALLAPAARGADSDADVRAIVDRNLPSLVGYYQALHAAPELSGMEERTSADLAQEPVSYTHLTLPTILRV